MAKTIRTECSGCMSDVKIVLDKRLEGVAKVNGKSSDVFYVVGEDTYGLVMWDCADCGYADSYDRTNG